MKKRVKTTKIGDIFVTEIDTTVKRYIQLIAIDKSLLNSDVIRVFKKSYPIESESSIDDIISDEVDFYSHTTTSAGVKFELWKLVGNTPKIGIINHILFYSIAELPDEFGVWVNQWRYWKISQEEEYSSKPKSQYKGKGAESGLIFSPYSIINRLQGTFVNHDPEYK